MLQVPTPHRLVRDHLFTRTGVPPLRARQKGTTMPATLECDQNLATARTAELESELAHLPQDRLPRREEIRRWSAMLNELAELTDEFVSVEKRASV
jgi:hypothetical protein